MKTLCFLVTTSVWALEPLPEGPGLSQNHPGDSGLEKHPAVLLVENFEQGTLEALRPVWNEIENQEGKVLEIMNRHYDAHGLQGNGNVLRWLLGRTPISFEEHVRELSLRT
jgi:hypothetical protein